MQSKNTIIGIVVVVIILIVLVFWYLTAFNNPAANIGSIPTASSSQATSGTKSGSVSGQAAGTGSQTAAVNPNAPAISSFSPASAAVNTVVTIRGKNFATTTSNMVMFGVSSGLYSKTGVAQNAIATVASSDGTTLTFTVPAQTASGIFCDASDDCTSITAKSIAPGTYPVSIENANGTSAFANFTVVN